MKQTITLTENEIKTLIKNVLKETLVLDAIDKDKIYDIYISVINNNREIYNVLVNLAKTITKHISNGEDVTFEHLANSSVMDKIVRRVIEIYNNLPSINPTKITAEERKELKKWTTANVFHILDDMGVLTDQMTASFEESPYFSISNL